MNINNSFNANCVRIDSNSVMMCRSPSMHNNNNNNSCDKEHKTKQFVLCNNAQHNSMSVSNYNYNYNTPTNQLSPSFSHKVLLTRINYKNNSNKNKLIQLQRQGKCGWELPFIESKIGIGNNNYSGSSSYKRFFSHRNSILHNNSNSNSITGHKKYHFTKIGTSPEQIHKDIISSVKNIHHYKTKIKPIEIDINNINNNNDDNCSLHLNNIKHDSVYEKAEQIKFANEYNKKLIDKDIRHIILYERHKATEKINTLLSHNKDQHNKQILWNKQYKPLYLNKLDKSKFIRKNHPMLEINQVGTLPEMFNDGNFMNKLLNDGFTNVANQFNNNNNK